MLGGKYGEMSTLGNYMFQSFNFRNKTKLRPFYSLVSSIFAEEIGHVELVSTGIAMLNNGPGNPARTSTSPRHPSPRCRMCVLPAASCRMRRRDADEFERRVLEHGHGHDHRNLIIDLLHNFHLECGARIHKLRVYETMSEPTGVRSARIAGARSLHAHAYALA